MMMMCVMPMNYITCSCEDSQMDMSSVRRLACLHIMIRMRVYRFSEDLFEKSLRRMDYQSFYFGRDYNFHDTRDEFQAGSDTCFFFHTKET